MSRGDLSSAEMWSLFLQFSINTWLERFSTIDVVEFKCNYMNSLFYLDKKVVGKFTLLHFCMYAV